MIPLPPAPPGAFCAPAGRGDPGAQPRRPPGGSGELRSPVPPCGRRPAALSLRLAGALPAPGFHTVENRAFIKNHTENMQKFYECFIEICGQL